ARLDPGGADLFVLRRALRRRPDHGGGQGVASPPRLSVLPIPSVSPLDRAWRRTTHPSVAFPSAARPGFHPEILAFRRAAPLPPTRGRQRARPKTRARLFCMAAIQSAQGPANRSRSSREAAMSAGRLTRRRALQMAVVAAGGLATPAVRRATAEVAPK